MDIGKAIKYCENHECTECPIYTNDLDKRTKEERENGVLCCENLTRYDENEIMLGFTYKQ